MILIKLTMATIIAIYIALVVLIHQIPGADTGPLYYFGLLIVILVCVLGYLLLNEPKKPKNRNPYQY